MRPPAPAAGGGFEYLKREETEGARRRRVPAAGALAKFSLGFWCLAKAAQGAPKDGAAGVPCSMRARAAIVIRAIP